MIAGENSSSCPRDIREFIHTAAGDGWASLGAPYLLLDGAQLPEMCDWLAKYHNKGDWLSLLGESAGSPLLAASPVLIRVAPTYSQPYLRRLMKFAEYWRSFAVLVSTLPLDTLAEHLGTYFYIDDPDGTRWGLAYWDTSILGALTGFQPALNGLVPGPVLSREQCTGLLGEIALWCFNDREARPCTLRQPNPTDTLAAPPFILDQRQMDQLGDIPLPDQVTAILKAALPEINANYGASTLHAICCEAIRQCRAEGTDDLAAYCDVASEILKQYPTQEASE